MTSATVGAHGQAPYRWRFDWGLAGARPLLADALPGDVAVVVDVLSFTTTLTVAVEKRIEVFPYPWAAADAATYAEERGAVLAVGRRSGLAGSASGSGSVSLSPVSFEGVARIDRVVLPSPNGSALSFALRDAGVTVVGASLRNAPAVGRWLRGFATGRVCVMAAGERWPEGSLRPAVEDLWGAGAVLEAAIDGRGSGEPSPEAEVAVAAYAAVRDRIADVLPACASGRELVEAGFAGDVELAADVAASDVIPVLRGEAFTDAR